MLAVSSVLDFFFFVDLNQISVFCKIKIFMCMFSVFLCHMPGLVADDGGVIGSSWGGCRFPPPGHHPGQHDR